MSNKVGGDPAASALAKKRWGKATAKKRSQHARKMAEDRWDAYYKLHPDKLKAKKAREAKES